MRKGIVVRNEAALRRRAKEIRSNRGMRKLTESLKMMWQPQLLRSLEPVDVFIRSGDAGEDTYKALFGVSPSAVWGRSSIVREFLPLQHGERFGIKCYKIPSQGGPDEGEETGEETTEQLPQ